MKNIKLLSVLFFVLLSITSLVAAQGPPPIDIEGGEVIAEGFHGPQGVLIDPDGNIWVIDSGIGGEEELQFISTATGEQIATNMGPSARIVMILAEDMTQTDVATLPSLQSSEMEFTGGARLALLDGTLYATSGVWMDNIGDAPDNMGTIVKIEDGEITEVADTWAFEEENNPDGYILESHPYGLTASEDGMLWVADAGANTLLKIDPETGEVALAAVFDGLPGAFPNQNRGGLVEADPVPTAVVLNEDGSAYVSLLSGGPFIPGSTKVVMVGVMGEVVDFATGLTMLTDLQLGPDGELYAIQFGMFTVEGPVPNAGAIIRVKDDDASEIVVDSLPFPTGLAFDDAGNAYIAVNGVGAPGSGAVVRIDGLVDMPGHAMMMGE